MARFGRSTTYLTGAGVLVLVAFAAFLIIDLGSRSVDPSSLPVIQLGRSTPATPGETSGDPVLEPQQPGEYSPTASTAGSATTGSTVRETINGGVHTGTSGGSSGGTPGNTGTSGPGASGGTATSGGR